MVFKRYIKRRVNGKLKTFGPYYYENHRDKNGKVTSVYLGLAYHKESRYSKTSSKPPRAHKKTFFKNNPLILVGIFILLVINIVNIMFLLQVSLTGKASVFVDSISKPDEMIQGKVVLTMRQGELVPADTRVIIKNNEQEKEYLLKELFLNAPIVEENFYMRNKELTGSGAGFGEIGQKIVYPEVSFTMKITSSEPIEEVESVETGESVQEAGITGQIINSFYSFFGLSGRTISDLESEIEATVSKDKSYMYNLLEGQSAEIVFSSQTVKLTIENGIATVTTDYSIVEQGFGEEFLGEDIEFFFNLDELGLIAQEGELLINFVYNDIELLSANKMISEVVVESPIVSERDIIETTVQENAVVNEPVVWKKDIQLKKQGKVTIEVPKEAENIKVFESGEQIPVNVQDKQNDKQITIDSDAFRYRVEYETPSPRMSKSGLEKGKKIVVSSQIPYNNVLVKVDIKNLNVRNPEQIIIYSADRQEPVTAQDINDLDSDGILDSVEWIIPLLENETFEIIVITKAYHLDSNRTFISDIYNEVYGLDNIWSETINNNEYVRVAFEENLTKENDITIYPRVVSGSPVIEVYEIDSYEKIAEFSSLISDEYNTIYLNNLISESQDVFELRIINGSVEFEHIVDPVAQPGGAGGVELRSQACTAENNAPKGSFGMVCDGTYPASCPADLVSCNDGSVESHNSNANNNYGGIRIQTYNNLVTDCTGITSVFICYNWRASGTQITDCDISVDSNNGASYSLVTSLCPTRVVFLEPTCVDVTGLESWNCGNFFGVSGPRALVKSEFRRTSSTRTVYWDALFFNVTYTKTNSPPTIDSVPVIPDQNPSDGGTTAVVFEVQVSDPDGYADISSVTADFTMTGESTRNTICTFQNNVGSNTAIYSCTVDMWYYDNSGTWNVVITATDSQSQQDIDASRSFTYTLLKSIKLNLPAGALTWLPLGVGQTSVLSNNDPNVIENIGNYEGPILITAYSLIGADLVTEFNANNFWVGSDTGGAECSATQLQHLFQVSVTGSNLPRGLGAIEEIYYCIASVPNVKSQAYSTSNPPSQPWIITI